MKDIRDKIQNYLKVLIAKKGDAGDECDKKHRIKYFCFGGKTIDRKSR